MTSERQELLQAALVGYRLKIAEVEEELNGSKLMADSEPRVVRGYRLKSAEAEAALNGKRRKRTMSAAGRAAIAAATKKRWRQWRREHGK